MSDPKELLYTSTHEWLDTENGMVTVGITDFAQKEMTDIVFVELPDIGRKVEKGEAVAVVESVKTASDIYSPVAGEIVEVNGELSDKPELINEEPYGAGWIFKVKVKGQVNRAEYMDNAAYARAVAGGGAH
jgi:glycine cleavage system H protein